MCRHHFGHFECGGHERKGRHRIDPLGKALDIRVGAHDALAVPGTIAASVGCRLDPDPYDFLSCMFSHALQSVLIGLLSIVFEFLMTPIFKFKDNIRKFFGRGHVDTETVAG